MSQLVKQNVPMNDLKIQYAQIKSEIDAAMAAVVANTSFILSLFRSQSTTPHPKAEYPGCPSKRRMLLQDGSAHQGFYYRTKVPLSTVGSRTSVLTSPWRHKQKQTYAQKKVGTIKNTLAKQSTMRSLPKTRRARSPRHVACYVDERAGSKVDRQRADVYSVGV